MAYNESIANRVDRYLETKSVSFERKKMMGGVVFMVDGKMCVGVESDRLMVRLDPATQEHALKQAGCTPMDFTGRPMRGFVWVDERALNSPAQLHRWIDRALAFNPLASRSARRTRSPAKKR